MGASARPAACTRLPRMGRCGALCCETGAAGARGVGEGAVIELWAQGTLETGVKDLGLGMGRMSREKGKRAEREVAELLRAHGFQARRGVQFQGGADSPDVTHDIDGLHIEVKRTEAFRLYQALEQAKDERKAGDIPAVFHRANGRPWVVVLEADDFLTLVRSRVPA